MPPPSSTLASSALVSLFVAAGLIAGCRADSGRQAAADADSATPHPASGADASAPPRDTASPSESPPAPAAEPAPRGFAPLPPGAPLVYTCDDDTEVRVAYGDDAATLTLPGGRTARLPKAQSASNGGGEVYVGDGVSLMRDDVRLELHQDGMPARTCHQHQT